jgi:hypothetical protein
MMADYFRARRMTYGLILFFITLTGFAQMPVFERYYLSSVPGLGWLAQFYVTHLIHYGMAALLLGFGGYVAMAYVLTRRHRTGQTVTEEQAGTRPVSGDRFTTRARLTPSGWVKIASLAGLILTGSLMVVKNLSGVFFPHAAVIALDLLHLTSCMVLLAATAYTWIRHKPWLAKIDYGR